MAIQTKKKKNTEAQVENYHSSEKVTADELSAFLFLRPWLSRRVSLLWLI